MEQTENLGFFLMGDEPQLNALIYRNTLERIAYWLRHTIKNRETTVLDEENEVLIDCVKSCSSSDYNSLGEEDDTYRNLYFIKSEEA